MTIRSDDENIDTNMIFSGVNGEKGDNLLNIPNESAIDQNGKDKSYNWLQRLGGIKDKAIRFGMPTADDEYTEKDRIYVADILRFIQKQIKTFQNLNE